MSLRAASRQPPAGRGARAARLGPAGLRLRPRGSGPSSPASSPSRRPLPAVNRGGALGLLAGSFGRSANFCRSLSASF